ncbi:IncA protein [Chlamydia serpentis]|uniref:IncA protein n=1 Tax=Chlamydia serpentis TaxID=1967782 RepID=A0A2R8FAF5_9CHLA|nr:hypothetical protein [Chlamydia serpentis]SPN73413.1 IncA protein [Chlamydia serpentis]
MSLNSTNKLLNQPELITNFTALDPRYINQDRKVFACVVTQLIIATLAILVGVILLCTMGTLGLSVPLSIVIGTLGVTLGTVILVIDLVILVKKSLRWIQSQQNLEQALKQNHQGFTIPKNDKGNTSASCLPVPLDIENPTIEASTPVSRFRIACSTTSTILGISLLIGAIVSVFFLSGYLQLGLCAGLACLGATCLVAGLAGLRTHSLITQGIMYLYLNYYLSGILEEKNTIVKDQQKTIASYLDGITKKKAKELTLLRWKEWGKSFIPSWKTTGTESPTPPSTWKWITSFMPYFKTTSKIPAKETRSSSPTSSEEEFVLAPSSPPRPRHRSNSVPTMTFKEYIQTPPKPLTPPKKISSQPDLSKIHMSEGLIIKHHQPISMFQQEDDGSLELVT